MKDQFKELIETAQAQQKQLDDMVNTFKESLGGLTDNKEDAEYLRNMLDDAMKGKAPTMEEITKKLKDANGSNNTK